MSRSRFRRSILSILAMLAAVSGPGCETGPAVSTSKTEATVRGKVLVRGKVVTLGRVVFDPANYRRKDVTARGTDLNKDGSFTITTLIGENSVRYEGPAIAGNRELEGMVLSCDVKEGENQFDIILPPR